MPTRLPNISFELPPSWAGYEPVSDAKDEQRQLYFWMFPAEGDVGHDDLIIWLNGGPGCSSLSGLLTEEGPIKFDPVSKVAHPNPHSWTKLSNVMWLDQPAGTGFSRGPALNQSMPEVAKDFNGFLHSLYKDFPKLRGKNLYIAGESYAGKMVPYLAAHIYEHEGANRKAGINLAGIGIDDGFFMDEVVRTQLPAVQFAKLNAKVMNLTQADLHTIERDGEQNGIATYVEDNLHYPPKGLLPHPSVNSSTAPAKALEKAAKARNKCFSPFYIANKAPCPVDALGEDDTTEKSNTHNYFNRNPEVKKLIHADTNISWIECVKNKAFDTMKDSLAEFPALTVLPKVIEKSKRTVIQQGTYDYLLPANGTALAIQNMTWDGSQGFQHKPNRTLVTQGNHTGTFHVEKKLTLVTVDKSGHMIPIYKPTVASQLLQYTLGQISDADLSRQSGA